MDSEKKDKKRPYETPKIYELDVDLTQAMGQTQCARGRQAAGACSRGAAPTGVTCARGQSATTQCGAGTSPGTTCSRGANPAM